MYLSMRDLDVKNNLEVIKSLTFTANLVQPLCTHLCVHAAQAHCLHTHSMNSKGRLLRQQVLASVAAQPLAQIEDFFLISIAERGKCKGRQM